MVTMVMTKVITDRWSGYSNIPASDGTRRRATVIN